MEAEHVFFGLPLNKLEPIFKRWVKEVHMELQKQKEPNSIQPIEKPLKYYTRKEVCKILGISLVTLSDYISKGVISCHRIGKNIRFTDKQIKEALIEINYKKPIPTIQ